MYVIFTELIATLTLSDGSAPDNNLSSKGKVVQSNLYSHRLRISPFGNRLLVSLLNDLTELKFSRPCVKFGPLIFFGVTFFEIVQYLKLC